MSKIIKIDSNEFIIDKLNNVKFVFSTAKGNLNFNKNLQEGRDNLNLLKEYFKLNEIGYMNQFHSDVVVEYDGKVDRADAIVTDKPNVGIGIFTADCVPILLYDKDKKVTAAIHSGWEGTRKNILGNTVDYLIQKYDSKPSDIVAYIGPHNRQCCYEFGKDEANKFFREYIKRDESIFLNNKLNLEKCIIIQLEEKGILDDNINTMNFCTYCNEEIDFYSYRRDKNKNYGRMFSFVVMNNY